MQFKGKWGVTAIAYIQNNVKTWKSVSMTIKCDQNNAHVLYNFTALDLTIPMWISPVYCNNSNTSLF